MRYLVCYDINEDRVRAHVAAILEAFGPRVQESVFECELSEADLALLVARVQRALGPEPAGNVRVYRLCRDCLAASRGIGPVAAGVGVEPCVVI